MIRSVFSLELVSVMNSLPSSHPPFPFSSSQKQIRYDPPLGSDLLVRHEYHRRVM